MARDRVALAVDPERPDHALTLGAWWQAHAEDAVIPPVVALEASRYRPEVGRLTPVKTGGLNEIVRPQRDVQHLLQVQIEVSEAQPV